MRRISAAVFCLLVPALLAAQATLPGTAPLRTEGDLAEQMVDGIHLYLDRATADAPKKRAQYWNVDFSSRAAYVRSVEPNRRRLRRIIGAVDPRVPNAELELIATVERPARIASGGEYDVFAVRWQALPGVYGEGLLLQPRSRPVARVVSIPDADWTPETLAGLSPDADSRQAFAQRLVQQGCQVIIPTLVDRGIEWSRLDGHRRTNLSHREFLYRMSFELGRHVIGYEVQKVLSAVDYFEASNREDALPIAVVGYGEGGLLALYSAALDTRIDAALVSGYFQSREELWQETIDRDVWGLLREFGDAEIASLIAPRTLIIEAASGPEVAGPRPAPEPNGDRAASGRLVSPPIESVRSETERARAPYRKLNADEKLQLVANADRPGSEPALALLVDALSGQSVRPPTAPAQVEGKLPDAKARLKRQFDQIVDYNHKLVRDSPLRRAEFWSDADNSTPAAWRGSTQRHRDYVWSEVIGRLPDPDLPTAPRSRVIYDHEDFRGYEVVLDVWREVFAYGILLVPKNLKEGERRPVVVAQHGLEGRPQEVNDPDVDNRAYHRYGARLAQEGFIVYAPQNPYIGRDRFRRIQRKAHPLKLALFSFILGQHQRSLDWLASLPFVDGERIGLYGISYGGKTAMRVPSLLDGYALSICSADFNEWIWKNTSTTDPYSYLFTQEYDMIEFDLANVANYAELATLIAPRPFMVERGHRDGVAPDEWVAYEYAKVRRFYTEMGLADKTEIEFFDGPHEIHGDGTFEFLRKHLGP